MGWDNRENNSQNPKDKTPVIDRCNNCGNQEQIHTQITMEYEGSLKTGHICWKCYSANERSASSTVLTTDQAWGP